MTAGSVPDPGDSRVVGAVDPTKEALKLSLDAQRAHVLGSLEGLDDASLRRPMLPTHWSCIGLVHHLALDVERFWFGQTVAGEPADDPGDHRSAWEVDPSTPPGAVSYTHLFSPSAELISVRASVEHTSTAMGDGLAPAGWGGRVVDVLAAPPEHPAAASPATATTRIIAARPRTRREYQRRCEAPGQARCVSGGGPRMATSSTCSVIGNRSKARSESTVHPASRATRRSRANEAGSQDT